jgi:hypothetical protein
MDEIDTFIAQIREAGDEVWMAGSQSEEAIVELERALGVAMPPSYRQFLSRFGGVGIVNSFISGIIEGKPLEKGTGWLYGDTQGFRDDFDMPEYLLIVQANEDAPYCLDTRRRSQDGEFPLVCYELHSRRVGDMAPSFGAWFVERLRLRAESVAEQ